jgi:hypothetical protein
MYKILYIPEAEYIPGVSSKEKDSLKIYFYNDISFVMPGEKCSFINLTQNRNLFEIVEVPDNV